MFRTLLSPMNELQQMVDVMDRAFDSLWADTRFNRDIVNTLPVDIWQKDNAYFICAAVPGVKPEDLSIQVQDNVLTIAGETKHEATYDSDVTFWRREYSIGRFARSIRLPEIANVDKIEASFDNGFVTITIPLAIQQPKSLRVPVKVGGQIQQQPVLESRRGDSDRATEKEPVLQTNRQKAGTAS